MRIGSVGLLHVIPHMNAGWSNAYLNLITRNSHVGCPRIAFLFFAFVFLNSTFGYLEGVFVPETPLDKRN